jgi:ectoine hydroxylase-related dioxygenase (phytanoyl-CoA dioxygenase family)
MWAMTDFNEENGATRVIPGSHRWADKLRPSGEQTVPAEMAKGSVLFYVGSLYHGGGANRTTTPRRGINVGYTLSWLRQEENQYLACPPDVARTLPVELAKLIGYRRGAYALGYVAITGPHGDPRSHDNGQRLPTVTLRRLFGAASLDAHNRYMLP